MNKLALALTFVMALASNNATAKWIYVNSNITDGRHYLEMSTIRKNGNTVKVWELVDYRTPDQGDLSSKLLREFDCKEGTSRLIAGSFYTGNMGSGKTNAPVNKIADWKPIIPETMGEEIWKYACGKKEISEAALSDSSLKKWTLIDSNEKRDFYLDLSGKDVSVKKNANKLKSKQVNFVKIWSIHDQKNVQRTTSGLEFLSRKYLEEFDCKGNAHRPLKAAYFTEKMGSGNVVFDVDSPSESWEPVVPDSLGVDIKKIACGEMLPTIQVNKAAPPAEVAPPAEAAPAACATCSEPTIPNNASTEALEAAIARNFDLTYWRKNDSRLFQEAIKVDEKLLADPKYSGISVDDRFIEVVRIVKVQELQGK